MTGQGFEMSMGVTSVYDAVGRLKSVTDIKGNQSNPTYSTVYEYDNMGRLLKETIPFEDISGTIYYTIKKHEYDLNGNIVKEKITKNKPGEATSYDETRYEYNGLNRLVKVITYNNGNPVNYTQYYYDAVGNKIRMYTGLSSPLTITGVDLVTTNGDTDYSVTKYEYNRFGLVTKMIDPLGKFVQYIYDLNGNLTQQVDRNGNTATLAYDGLNRLLSNQVVSLTDPEMNAAYAFTYSRTGNRKTMTSGGATTNYVYDDLGRLITETEANGFVKSYTYDAHNSRKSLNILQSGTTVNSLTYTYNKLDQLHQVMDNGLLAATYTYDDNGNRATLAYPNGNNTVYQYNLANQLKSLINKNGATQLSAYQYNYYLNGNPATKADAVSLKSSAYLYDGLGRLIDETERVNSVVASTITYGYDDYNNRSVMTSTGKTTNYSYDKNNRLLTETSLMGSATQIARYGYDENGNQRIKTTEYVNPIVGGQAEGYQVSLSGENGAADTVIQEFDGFNQLIQTTIGNTTIGYTYNGDGLRTSKTVNGLTTSHIWDGQDIALDVQAGAVKSKYIRGINLLYAQDDVANKQYYLFNGHGDVVQLTSSVGTVTKSYEYDAFGNELNPVASDTNPFRYTGEYLDKETGRIYLRARYYDPSVGRFISEDSYEGTITNPLSLNLYTYVHNNPLIYHDASGNKPMYIYKKETGYYEYLSSLEFGDGIITGAGFFPGGSYIMEGVKWLRGKTTGHYIDELDVDKKGNLEKVIKSNTFSIILDGFSLYDEKLGKIIAPVSHGITAQQLLEDFVKEDKIDDLVDQLFINEFMRAKSEEVLAQKYVIAASYVQGLINSNILVYSFKGGKLTHNLTNNQIGNMYGDLIKIYKELKIADE